VERLHDNRVYLYEKLTAWCESIDNILGASSDERSPIVMLQVAELEDLRDLDTIVFCEEVVRECLLRGVALCATNRETMEDLSETAVPSIRITLSASQTHADINIALAVLQEAVGVVMARFREEVVM
jgi:7-keto-8-aminopelargonate synthetase-like enzyme